MSEKSTRYRFCLVSGVPLDPRAHAAKRASRPDRRAVARGLRHPGVPRLRVAGAASAGHRPLLLSRGRNCLRDIWIEPPTGGRTDVGNVARDRHQRRDDGRRRSFAGLGPGVGSRADGRHHQHCRPLYRPRGQGCHFISDPFWSASRPAPRFTSHQHNCRSCSALKASPAISSSALATSSGRSTKRICRRWFSGCWQSQPWSFLQDCFPAGRRCLSLLPRPYSQWLCFG